MVTRANQRCQPVVTGLALAEAKRAPAIGDLWWPGTVDLRPSRAAVQADRRRHVSRRDWPGR